MTAQDSHFFSFLPGEAGEVPRRGGGVIGNNAGAAHDPSAPAGHLPTLKRREERVGASGEEDLLMRSFWS